MCFHYIVTILTSYKTMYTSQYEVGVCLMFMQDGGTALMYASKRGEAGTVRVLLDHGAIVDLRDNVRCYFV